MTHSPPSRPPLSTLILPFQLHWPHSWRRLSTSSPPPGPLHWLLPQVLAGLFLPLQALPTTSPGRCTSRIPLPHQPSPWHVSTFVLLCLLLFFNVLSVWARILSIKDTQFHSRPGKLRGAKGSQAAGHASISPVGQPCTIPTIHLCPHPSRHYLVTMAPISKGRAAPHTSPSPVSSFILARPR